MKSPIKQNLERDKDRLLKRALFIILALALLLAGLSGCKQEGNGITFGGPQFDLPHVTSLCNGTLDQENSARWTDPTSEQIECVRHNTGMPDWAHDKLFVQTPHDGEAEAQWMFKDTNLSAYVRPDGEARRFGLYLS